MAVARLVVVLLQIYNIAFAQFSCYVGSGDDQSISGTVSCGTITIEGILRVASNTYLTADRIEVKSTGTLYVGTSSSPVSNVVIYLNHAMGYNHVTESGSSTTSGQLMSYGSTYMYGVAKTYWTLLNQDCTQCSTISVDECTNWAVGDLLVVAPTGNGVTSFGQLIQSADNFKSEERSIAAISTSSTGSCLVTLNSALSYSHRGAWIDGVVPTQAEVLNMDRSILITGPEPHVYDSSEARNGFQGITTRQSGSSGIMQIHNVRVEKCGRVELGEYCLHFHYVGDCPLCQFVGNVVTQGNNKGITVHATHHSAVDHNIIYDIRGAFIYIEDGNEYENVISNNVLVCPEVNNYAQLGAIAAGTRCMLYGVTNQEDADNHEQSGIYINAPSNHIIGNHVVGMENALFINAVFNWGNPDGGALYRVCKLSMPMGITKGNVFHNNAGFGWYANSLYSTKVKTDENGYVADWTTCNLFNMQTGTDQSQNILVQDHVEYFEDFSMGVYECGDITFKNVISAFNNKGLYWKSYRRGANSAAFCINCTFYNNDIQIMGPGGSGVMEFVDSSILSTASSLNRVYLNHHCGLTGAPGVTGGLCASHYVFNDVDFGSISPTFYSETHDSGSLAATDAVVFYNGYSYHDTSQSHVTFNAASNGCAVDGDWTKCASSLGIRNVRIYSPNRGTLTVTASGVSYSVPFRSVQRYMGYNTYDTSTCTGGNAPYGPQDYTSSGCAHRVWPGGYTFIVQNGANIIVNVPQYSGEMADTFVMEYSDIQLDSTSITVTVTGDSTLSGGPCTISSTHSRTFITQYGPLVPQAGAWWTCKNGWTAQSGVTEFTAQIVPLALNLQVSGSSSASVKAMDDVSVTTTTTTTTSVTTTTTTTTSSASECGYVPSTCQGDLDWAVNTGSQSNPEYYPNFYQVTGVAVSAASSDDMVFYWVCSGINPNDNCPNLQIPCGRTSCTSAPSVSPTAAVQCGYIPPTCQGDLSWAVNSGSQGHPEWYPNFYETTGVAVADTTEDDMVYYWVCSGTNPNGNCDGLELPCSRTICGVSFEAEQDSKDKVVLGTYTWIAVIVCAVLVVIGVVICCGCCLNKKRKKAVTDVNAMNDDEKDGMVAETKKTNYDMGAIRTNDNKGGQNEDEEQEIEVSIEVR